MQRIFLFLAGLLTADAALAAEPKPLGLDIAAIVDDEVISTYDVNSRVQFVIVTTNLPNTKDVREGIRPQVLRSLINEQLQLQHTKKEGIEVSDQEITRAIANIEKQRNMSDGAIFRMLDKNNIPRQAFSDQIRAQLAWGKIVIGRLRPQVNVSDEEVRKARIRPVPEVPEEEMRIAVLLLPVEKAGQEAEVKKAAERLSGEIRKGASFEEVYRQFSGLSSGSNPDTFWVKPGQLDPLVSRVLAGARADMTTPPVRTRDGYLIVKVYETRAVGGTKESETEVLLKEIVLRLKQDASQQEANLLLGIGEEVAKHPGTCEEQGIASIDNMEDVDIEVRHRRSGISELPPAIRIIAENLQVGDISTPFASSEGIRLFMLCEKKTAKKKEVQFEQLVDLLFQQKLELEAQKYLRNLRREAFIDIRD
ncbi:MAG: peptidylprolyl isomerase [Alphaproteobacteria bacterium]